MLLPGPIFLFFYVKTCHNFSNNSINWWNLGPCTTAPATTWKHAWKSNSQAHWIWKSGCESNCLCLTKVIWEAEPLLESNSIILPVKWIVTWRGVSAYGTVTKSTVCPRYLALSPPSDKSPVLFPSPIYPRTPIPFSSYFKSRSHKPLCLQEYVCFKQHWLTTSLSLGQRTAVSIPDLGRQYLARPSNRVPCIRWRARSAPLCTLALSLPCPWTLVAETLWNAPTWTAHTDRLSLSSLFLLPRAGMMF